MDHATKFRHRHSLNGREAAAHFQGHTLNATRVRPNSLGGDARRRGHRLETSVHVSALLRSVPTFFSKKARRTAGRLSSWKMKKRTFLTGSNVPNFKPFNLTKQKNKQKKEHCLESNCELGKKNN